MRNDAIKQRVSWRMKPECIAMLEEMWNDMKPEGWSKANIIEQSITDFYWNWRSKSNTPVREPK